MTLLLYLLTLAMISASGNDSKITSGSSASSATTFFQSPAKLPPDSRHSDLNSP